MIHVPMIHCVGDAEKPASYVGIISGSSCAYADNGNKRREANIIIVCLISFVFMKIVMGISYYLMGECVKVKIELFQILSTFLYGFEMIFIVNNNNSHVILMLLFQQYQSNILVFLVLYDEKCCSISV